MRNASSSPIRFDRSEAGGALGDLGTYIPLLVGMVSICGLQLVPALFTSGLANMVTGLMFGIPMPVQPMKAIAAIAIDDGLTEPQILAAGIATGAVILLLGATGLIDWLARHIPKSVVRGLQLALGLKLLGKGVTMIVGTNVLLAWDSIGMGVLCAAVILALYFSKRFPGALVVFVIGLGALFAASPKLLGQITLGTEWRLPDLTSWANWKTGVIRGAIPQIPLTTLNSVIAVCALSLDLFPQRSAGPRRVAVSVGLMNLLACPVGGMPICHGAGGLAAQYRFGARTGGSVVMLGAAKMALALLFGSCLFSFLHAYPQSVLGALLAFGGLELAVVCRDQTAREDFFVMVLTAGVCTAINVSVGFVIGWIIGALLLAKVIHVDPAGIEDKPRP